MKQLVVTALCCVFLACASSTAKIPAPEIELVQISGPADQNYTSGDIEVQYGVRITNRAAVPITLRNIQIRSTGVGGPYRLQPATYYFNRAIEPEKYEDVAFWAKAVAEGDAMSMDANAPVTIRATAFFESPSGGLRHVFTKVLGQRLR